MVERNEQAWHVGTRLRGALNVSLEVTNPQRSEGATVQEMASLATVAW